MFMKTLNLRTSCISFFGLPISMKSRTKSLITDVKLQSIFILLLVCCYFLPTFRCNSRGNVMCSAIFGSMLS